MKQKDLYIVVAVIVVSIFLAIILSQLWAKMLLKNQQSSAAAGTAPIALTKEFIAPSIERMNGRLGETMKSPQKNPAYLAQVYSQYPEEGTGNNMVALWAKISPKEKTKAIEQLDQQITEANKTVNANPADKKAKHMLFVSETLKKMCKSNFDFNLLETIPQDQGGLKSRHKR